MCALGQDRLRVVDLTCMFSKSVPLELLVDVSILYGFFFFSGLFLIVSCKCCFCLDCLLLFFHLVNLKFCSHETALCHC